MAVLDIKENLISILFSFNFVGKRIMLKYHLREQNVAADNEFASFQVGIHVTTCKILR
jgi:hypothetical protein